MIANVFAVLGLGASGGGGIAWEAHIGGYFAGLLSFGFFDAAANEQFTSMQSSRTDSCISPDCSTINCRPAARRAGQKADDFASNAGAVARDATFRSARLSCATDFDIEAQWEEMQ